MGNFLESLKSKSLSRRSFIGAAALAATAATLEGCSSSESSLQTTDQTKPLTDGEWKSVVCWAHCDGCCVLQAYMVDGLCLRIRTDQSKTNTPDNPQRRACQLGRTRRIDVFGPNRLKYPMKRKNWQPGGKDFHPELRGRDEWERISWDEAIDIVSSEITRIKETYGNRSIWGSDAHKAADSQFKGQPTTTTTQETRAMRGLGFRNVLNLYGGFVTSWFTGSHGAWMFSASLYGYQGTMRNGNDRFDARNCDVAIMVGSNPAVTSDGTSMYAALSPMHDAGCKFYFIDPMYTDTCAMLDGEWIPIRIGTDRALYLAWAYEMFTNDHNGDIIDWDFLEKHCIGYDADHMPEGVDPSENFKDYVLGTYDNEPKTPEWASAICGISADKIRELAKFLGKDNKLAFGTGLAPVRQNNAETLCQLHMTLGSMGGHMGQLGHQFMTGGGPGAIFHDETPLINPGPWPQPQLHNPVDDVMHQAEEWDGMINHKYHYTGCMEEIEGEDRDINIKMLYNFFGNSVHSTINMAGAMKLWRSDQIEFSVINAIHMDDNSRYYDVVLPDTTPWEECPTMVTRVRGAAEYTCMGLKVTEPLYEARSSDQIGSALLEKWGIDPKQAYPVSRPMCYFSMFYGAKVLQPDGTQKPMLSFTEEEAALFGPEAQTRPADQACLSFSDFAKAGVYAPERQPGDVFSKNSFLKKFRDDPANNKMLSESGLFEVYSKRAKEVSEKKGYGAIPPIPKYVPAWNGYESTFDDYDKQIKGKYPFQLYSPHYFRSKHSHYDDIPWLREAFIRPVFISKADADAKGIKNGDNVRVFNDNGSVIRPACVTRRLMPGIVGLPHGGRLEYDDDTGYNIGGSDNWLTYSGCVGMGTDAYNSQICDFERYDGAFTPDVDRPWPMPECQNADN